MVASASPFFTCWPSCAEMAVTRPVAGEKTWATCRSSKVTRPLVTMAPPTGRSPTATVVSLASSDCRTVTHTSPGGGVGGSAGCS